ncbi:hypothetical protein [Sodalis glossinidius]|uniref:hypothetical protein n=1 Tax=Sodalis glossinidius TaxID=63612 RepID=UPI0014129B57|nr:hypothetical protein [Sodalis glossinidius]
MSKRWQKKVKASVIVDLLGNLPRQARLFGQSLVGMGRQGGASLHGLGLRANTLGGGRLTGWAIRASAPLAVC